MVEKCLSCVGYKDGECISIENCMYKTEVNRAQNIQDKIILATRKSNITKQTLLDTFAEKGLVGVYNLGLKNMLDYLDGN